MVISDCVKSLYYNIDEKAYCNGKNLYAGLINGNRYKSIFYFDNLFISELIEELMEVKIELGICLEGVIGTGSEDIIINIDCNKNFLYEPENKVNCKKRINRYKIKNSCNNKYSYIDVTNLIIRGNEIKYPSQLNLYLESCTGYIKISSYESNRKPTIRISGVMSTKHKKHHTIKCTEHKSCKVALEKKGKNKSYGHYINSSGAIEYFNEMVYITWENTLIAENIRLLKDKVTLLIKDKGKYVVNYMINIKGEGDCDSTIKLVLDNKPVIGSAIEVEKGYGPINGQIVVDVLEDNSQLNLVVEGSKNILIDKGVAASILIYNL